MKMAKDAALGMNWLHLSKPVFIHRDLKSGNLLVRSLHLRQDILSYADILLKVDNDFTVKVGDFGLTIMKEVNEKDKFGAIGTPLYMVCFVWQRISKCCLFNTMFFRHQR